MIVCSDWIKNINRLMALVSSQQPCVIIIVAYPQSTDTQTTITLSCAGPQNILTFKWCPHTRKDWDPKLYDILKRETGAKWVMKEVLIPKIPEPERSVPTKRTLIKNDFVVKQSVTPIQVSVKLIYGR
jgi:hypothetical protein